MLVSRKYNPFLCKFHWGKEVLPHMFKHLCKPLEAELLEYFSMLVQ